MDAEIIAMLISTLIAFGLFIVLPTVFFIALIRLIWRAGNKKKKEEE